MIADIINARIAESSFFINQPARCYGIIFEASAYLAFVMMLAADQHFEATLRLVVAFKHADNVSFMATPLWYGFMIRRYSNEAWLLYRLYIVA